MLPKEYKPAVKTSLVRIGPKFDGGYVTAEESLSGTSMIYGFGMSTDWSFEEDFKSKTGAQVVCFDHSVDRRFWRYLISKDFERMLMLKINPFEFWQTVKLFLNYRNFFDGKNATHRQQMIGPGKMGGIDLHALVKGTTARNVFFKIDIEGWEYRILDQLITYQDVMTGVVIEFHDVDLHREKIINFIKNFDLALVHVHGNNNGGTDVNGDPLVLEMTFKPRSSLDKPYGESISLPLPGVDNPNNQKIADYQLSFQ
jgi:hypothetical protein